MANYFVKASMADQGAARDEDDFVCGPESLKEIIDFVGTTNQATIVFESKNTGETTYTLTTPEMVPENITVKFWPGAIIDGAGTLTIAGHIVAGIHKIFGSSITVTLGDSYNDGVYPQWWNPDAGDGSTDCATAIQSAINACVGSVAGHYKCVYFVPGVYAIESTVTLKSAALIGKGGFLNSGIRFLWNGSSGGTMFDKDSSHEGNNTFMLIENLNFRSGSAAPNYFIDLTANTNSLDAHCRFKELAFYDAIKSPVKIGTWLNCHWEHFRFDIFGEYAIDIVPHASPTAAMGTFVLDGFTVDSKTRAALGIFHIDTETGQELSNFGTFEFANGRIEINTQMTATNPGVIVRDILDATAYSRSIGMKLRNVTIQDSASSSCYILQRVTADAVTGETLILENVRTDSLAGLVGGTVGSFNNIALVSNNIGYLAMNVDAGAKQSNIFDTTLLAPHSTNDALRLQNKDDSQARVVLDKDGYLEFGPGDGAVDTGLKRNSTPGSGIYGLRSYEATTNSGIAILNKTTELTSMTGATITWTNAIPAGSMVIGVTARVTLLITGATSFDVGISGGDTDLFLDGIAVALNTTGDLANSNAALTTPIIYQAATSILVTAIGSDFTAGSLRLTLHYIDLVAATG